MEHSLIDNAFSWAATGTGILAAVLVSLNLGVRVTGWAFVVFTVSSVAWMVTALMREEGTALFVQNAVMFVINLIGIYRYLLHPNRQLRAQMAKEAGEGQGAGSAGATAAA
ncbi:hypothetical protein [Parvularcula dongshanensis]|uniref:Nicotinamide riboside transporter PnuC n=1 Tax=Parvularcula dongshanensis TaxID=1173995 RepID=A0A840I5S8_9PROT|nr:hypothetical protein [Parvularcula dongshanensis]MBB4659762.1 hypothetical protein [Parvularcula dongshanensis]